MPATRLLLPALILIGSLHASETRPQPKVNLANMPLVFSPDVADAERCVRFTSRGPGYSLLFTQQEAVLLLNKTANQSSGLHLRIANTRSGAPPRGIDETPAKVNYFIGNQPEKWRTGVPTFRKVAYRAVLPGVDLIYYGRDGQLEYDFRLAAHADPRKLAMLLDSDKWSAELTSAGNLRVGSPDGYVEFARPVAYQISPDGSRQSVEASFRLEGARRFGFNLGRYDHNRELVIDPTLVYATFYGGSNHGYDYGNSIAVDSSGNAYVVGSTASNDLPGTNGYQPTRVSSIGGYGTYANYTAFIFKLNSTGTQLLAATYLGGSSSEAGNAIAVDSSGNVIVVGQTTSPDFPTQNPAQSTCGPAANIDRFYCTYTPTSTCGPQPNGNPTQSDAFITKLDTTLSHLVFSTFLGGTGNDWATAVTVDSAGNAFVAGATMSTPDTHQGCSAAGPYCGNDPPDQFALPTTANAFMQPPVSGGCTGNPYSDGPFPYHYGWFAKFSPAGGLDYSTYFAPTPANTSGQKTTDPSGIALDGAGNVYIAGTTQDEGFPTIAPTNVLCGGGGNGCNNGNRNAWVTKFNINNTGSSQVLYSTMFGGTGDDYGNGLAVDSSGNTYVVGNTNSSDFPTSSNAFVTTYGGNGAAFITKLTPAGNAVSYSTYLTGNGASEVAGNGIAVDGSGAAVVVGWLGGGGFTFPLVDPIQSTEENGTSAGYLIRMTPDGTNTLFSTYLGPSGTTLNSIALDTAENAYIAGNGQYFPTSAGAYQPSSNGNPNAIVAKVNMCTSSLTDISSQVQVTRGGMRYVHASNAFIQTLTIKNNGSSAINAPLFLLLNGLSSDAKLADANGTSTCVSPGSPYIEVLSSGSLGAGQSITVQLQFTDPTMGGITYSTAVLSGAGLP